MYTVTFSLEGYQPETRQVGFLAPGTVPNVSVQLRRADASFTGTVSGGGQPITGATVELTDGVTTRNTATAASPAGGYVFANVAAGRLHADRHGAGVPAQRRPPRRQRRATRSSATSP